MFYANTIGKISSPQESDIEKAFCDPEWGDVMGNVFTLETPLGKLSSISGSFYKNYSLSYFDGSDWKQANQSISVLEVVEYFKSFHRGEKEWMSKLEWQVLPQAGKLKKALPYIIIGVIALGFLVYHLSEILKLV